MAERHGGGSRLLTRLLGFGAGFYGLYLRLSAHDWLEAAIVGGLLLLWALEIVHRRSKDQ